MSGGAREPVRRVVFAGAGHAHLHALHATGEYVRRGLEVLLVAPEPFWYSGLGPGLLSGRYSAGDDTVEAGRLVGEAGGRSIQSRVRRIDAPGREIELEDGARIGWDLLSLNVGSRVPLERIEGAAEHGLPVKPVHRFLELRRRLLDTPAGRTCRLLVVGGGAAGCETVANALAAARGAGIALAPVLIQAGNRLLADHPPRAGMLVADWMRRRGIEVVTGRRVERVEAGKAWLDDGTALAFDQLMVATGVEPTPLARVSGLDSAADGSMLVGATLESASARGIFGGGDCISVAGHALDRVGVYAVRQGAVLHHNLLAAAAGEPLAVFRPQKRYLLILNLGDGTGLLLWNQLVLRGRWVFRFKEWLDFRFLRRCGGQPA